MSFCTTLTSKALCCSGDPLHIRNISVTVITLFYLLTQVHSRDIASCWTALESASSEYLPMERAYSK